jgi:hypothetical protein
MKNKLDKFFYIDSIPGVMFLHGHTSYAECKKYNGSLTKEEFKAAVKECSDRAKKKKDDKEKWLKENSQVVKDGKVVKKKVIKAD